MLGKEYNSAAQCFHGQHKVLSLFPVPKEKKKKDRCQTLDDNIIMKQNKGNYTKEKN